MICKTVASCCLHPCGGLASYCAGNKAYLWPIDQGKPWPCLPVRLYKAKRAMRMTAGNPESSSGSSSSSRAADSLEQLDASKDEFHQLVQYELRVVSLEAGSMGQVLAARSIAAADCLTCVQVSPTGQHVLLAYGRRSKQLSCLVAGQGSYQVWHTVLQVYRMSDLRLVRQLLSADDEVNVAAWHPRPGQGITYGTKAGRVRNIVACGADSSCHARPHSHGSAAAEATSVLQQALQ
ncbi:hypothetical protein OEZ85_008798 [Tetradesmus obliquus]|uniref:Uncharacterized protein n=1 Tax=Tetradesmus obliquus TaxID=3088 RepID=A0ABY8TLU4_TETOB|nr:hypothetical protein OEZ85_008798 [Tetradesmus obliquus]